MSLAYAERAPEIRLLGFLVLSALLHVFWLSLPVRFHATDESAGALAPLTARLLPQVDRLPEPARVEPAPKSAVTARFPEPFATTNGPESSDSTPTAEPAPSSSAAATVDVDAARASARAYAREPVARTSLDAPKLSLTVERAVAEATAPDVAVESRGAAGERVVQTRHTRCVTPLTVPLFMEGVTMLTQCGKR